MTEEIQYISDAREYPEYEEILHELEADLWKFTTSKEEIENIKILKEQGENECNDHFWELRQKYFEKELKKRGHLVELDQWSYEFKQPYTYLLNLPS
tara:strand:- start:614 stop:904 length:291 start_codon:yes stop_codon:yes gene_type:complete